MVDQLPALPQSQLELAEVALDSLFALLHGAEQGVEGVPFSFEGLLVVLEAASRKESGQTLRRCGLLRASVLSASACSRCSQPTPGQCSRLAPG